MSGLVLYAIRTDTVRRLDPGRLSSVLPQRAAKARRFRFEKDRLLCLGAGFLMLEALGIREESAIRYEGNGKPCCPGLPSFNLSHSGEWCILARGPQRKIGVDIEEIDPQHISLAPEVYTRAEQAWMAEDPVDRFFRLWTWKESVMKASGLGMSLEPRTFEVLPFAEGKPVPLLGSAWYASSGSLEGYAYSVCADEPPGEIRWTEITA